MASGVCSNPLQGFEITYIQEFVPKELRSLSEWLCSGSSPSFCS